MNLWSFHCPVRIEFGRGRLEQLAELCAFERAVLVTTPGFSRRGLTARIEAMLGDRLVGVLDSVQPNPDFVAVDAVVAVAKEHDVDGVIALGGGSAIDTAKAVARRLAEPGPALPIVAIPTTAGTGAEVTPFATVWNFETHTKHSITGSDLYPVLALLDPDLTLDLPEDVTISSGLDAISHAFESTWNRNAGPVSLALAARSLSLSLTALPALMKSPTDTEQRSAMMAASTMAGIAISQTRTALAHSISYPLTAHLGLAHGLACSFTLPEVLRFNLTADDGRLASLARVLGYDDGASLAEHLDAFLIKLGVADELARSVGNRDEIMALTERMLTPGRADNNIRDASIDDVTGIVERAAAALMAR